MLFASSSLPTVSSAEVVSPSEASPVLFPEPSPVSAISLPSSEPSLLKSSTTSAASPVPASSVLTAASSVSSSEKSEPKSEPESAPESAESAPLSDTSHSSLSVSEAASTVLSEKLFSKLTSLPVCTSEAALCEEVSDPNSACVEPASVSADVSVLSPTSPDEKSAVSAIRVVVLSYIFLTTDSSLVVFSPGNV